MVKTEFAAKTRGRLNCRIFLASLIIMAVVGSSALVYGQTHPRLKIRKEIERLEKKKASLSKRLSTEEARIAKTRAKIKKDFESLQQRDLQNDMGVQISSVLGKFHDGSAMTQANVATTELEKMLKKRLGRDLYQAVRRDIRNLVLTIYDEGKAPTAVRCARGFKDILDSTFSTSDFDRAWKMKLQSLIGARAIKIRQDIDAVDRDIDSRRRSLLGSISGNIPRGMVPVPAVAAGKLGITTKEIEALSKTNDEPMERNIKLFLGSQTERLTHDAFLMDQFEVTHTEYWHFCDKTGHRAPKDKHGNPIWPEGKIPEGWAQRPITHVDLDDAIEYAHWIGARIPTEFEWEIAARSGRNGFDGRYWAWGNTYEKFKCNDNMAHDVRERRTMSLIIPKGVDLAALLPVGFFKESGSPLGIHDMNGNAAEWTVSSFKPRATFQEVSIGKMHVARGDFDDEFVAVRGGHCDMRNLITSNFMRIGVHPRMVTKYIGFRCSRSAIPGLDVLNYVGRNGRLDARLTDFKKMKHDKSMGRDFPHLDQSKGRFSILQKLDFNEELGARGQAHSILLANRDMVDLTSEKDLVAFAKGEDDIRDSCLLGMFHTDVTIQDPALEPGTWFVTYKSARKYKDEETGKKKKDPASFQFIPMRPDKPVVTLSVSGSPVLVSKGILQTKLESSQDATSDRLTLVFSYPIKVRSNATFQVILNLKVEKDSLKGYF